MIGVQNAKVDKMLHKKEALFLRASRVGIAKYDPQEATDKVKIIAQFLGASRLGLGRVDERWPNATIYSPPDTDIPIVFDNSRSSC